jgi:hypothetical protein
MDTEVSQMSITKSVYQHDNAAVNGSIVFETLTGDRIIGAQKQLVHALGLAAAIYLNECIYWQKNVGIGNWFGRTIPQMFEETGLSKAEQAKVREVLREKGLIEEMKGAGFRTKTRVNPETYWAFLQSISAGRKSAAGIQRLESEQLAVQKPAASRPEISGSSNILEHTTTEDISDDDAIDLIGQRIQVYDPDEPVHVALKPDATFEISPYGYYEAYCNGRGIDPAALKGGPLQRELRTAKLIKQDGISAKDVHDCAAWLQSQQWWRDNGFNMNAIRTQYPRWVSSGCPLTQKAPNSKPIKGTTPII